MCEDVDRNTQICLQMLLHPYEVSIQVLRPQKVSLPWKKRAFHCLNDTPGWERRRYTCDRISCQLTLEHTADIYSFLETTVSSRRTVRQASKVNNMLTTISRPHANQVCQSHESCLLLWFRCGWKQASQRMVRQPRRAHEQQIEQFTTQDNGESLGNTKKTQQMLN